MPSCKSIDIAINDTHIKVSDQSIADLAKKKFLKSDHFCRSSVPLKKYSCSWDTLYTFKQQVLKSILKPVSAMTGFRTTLRGRCYAVLDHVASLQKSFANRRCYFCNRKGLNSRNRNALLFTQFEKRNFSSTLY